MMVDTRVYGYTLNGAAYHPACLPEGIDPNGPETGALFSYDSDGWDDGLPCDGCGDHIFEPTDFDSGIEPSDPWDSPTNRYMAERLREAETAPMFEEALT